MKTNVESPLTPLFSSIECRGTCDGKLPKNSRKKVGSDEILWEKSRQSLTKSVASLNRRPKNLQKGELPTTAIAERDIVSCPKRKGVGDFLSIDNS